MTADAQHARPGGATRAWRGFRQWRRSRPFWGGLFTVLAGAEIFGSTQASLAGLTLKMGPTGFLAWLIPTILVVCGLLMWFSPAQRTFYSIIAGVTAVYSLIGVNLGGFFIGMLLGMVGAALGFAWVPGRPTADEAAPPAAPTVDEPPLDEPDDDEAPLVDELMPRRPEVTWDDDHRTGVLNDTLPQPRNPLREPAPPQWRGGDDHSPEPVRDERDSTQVIPVVDPPAGGGSGRDPKLFAITLVLLSVSAVGLLAVRDQTPGRAAPAAPAAPVACPTPRGAATPAAPRPQKPAAGPSGSASPSPEPTASPSPAATGGNLFSDLVHGIGDLLTGGHTEEPPPVEPGTDVGATTGADAGASPASPAAQPSGRVVAPTSAPRTAAPSGSARTPTRTTPTATRDAAATPAGRSRTDGARCVTPKPAAPAKVVPGKVLPRLAPDTTLPKVAAQPSKLTGSSVRMDGLRFEGVTELATHDGGTLKALKFTMKQAVTDDFKLVADGPSGRRQQYVTDKLTVKRDPDLPGGGTNVAFYATRFVGWLGPIKITLTPDLPFPDGIPITSPIPITFGRPVIDLAFVRSDTLTASPSLQLDLA